MQILKATFTCNESVKMLFHEIIEAYSQLIEVASIINDYQIKQLKRGYRVFP